mgnify:FL=1
MLHIDVRIINRSHHALPQYATRGAAGMDLRAYLPEAPVTIRPGERALIPTGLYIQLPEGFEAQIRPRSGLALKHGIMVANSPGTIDCDYRGEIRVILLNAGREDFTIANGERICQMVVKEYVRVDWLETDTLDDTERAGGGFGHTGVS